VRDRDGRLAFAKFPNKMDEINVEAWEALALTLASRAGIYVPEWRLETIAKRPALLVRRFDREDNGKRRPFLSAMSMLGASDGEQHSYFEIVDALRQYGADPEADIRELWRRVVFSVLISNTDDHLRNHGFLYVRGGGWRLSPAYDLNPVPVDLKPRILATAITPDDPTASLALALEAAEYFGVGGDDARHGAREIATVVAGWRKTAAALGLAPAEIERMSSAFEHADLKAGLAL
jgi:serine/threonine-protein kinase HipA